MEQPDPVEDCDTPDWAQGTPEGRRVIELLWEAPAASARGPKPKITLPDVVRTGVVIADEDGVAELSMRKVAGRLGVGAMSLYTYVPGRSELIELMVDAVYAELDLPPTTSRWRDQVERLTRQRWQLYQRHPWLLDLNMARLPVGPHVFDVEEAMYAAVARSGLRGAEIVAVTNLVVWQVLGAARSQITDADEERHTGTSTEAYWMSRASFWFTYFSPERFPTISAIYDSGGFDDPDAHSFDRAVGRLLDAIEIMIEQRPRTAARA